MIITNKLGLPKAFVKYAKSDHEYKDNKYSVTELLKPVREIKLSRMHRDEIEKDVSDIIPALFGSAVHYILEINTDESETLLSEESLWCEIDGVVIVGRADLIDLDELCIKDYKTCSVSKILKEDFEEWRMQGLLYAYSLFKSKGIIMRHLKFYAIMKDWSKVRTNSEGYPKSAVYIYKYDIKDSDYDYIERWLINKIKELKEPGLPECSEKDKWFTGNKYAVYKNVGDKKAKIICDTEIEAHDYITNKCDGAGMIDVRKGENLKCKYYCDCVKWCKKGE